MEVGSMAGRDRPGYRRRKQLTFFLLLMLVLPVFVWVGVLGRKHVTGAVLPKLVALTGINGAPAVELRDKARINGAPAVELRDKALYYDDTVAKATISTLKVLCWITSTEKELHNKLSAVNETWARRCDKKIFIMTTKLQHPEIVNVNVSDGRSLLTKKTITTLKYLHEKYSEDYEWFLKADDDTFIIMENLKYLLSHYNPGDAIYVGHLLKKYSAWGYMSGGAGYVLSREALRQLVENGYNVKGKCKTSGEYEDVDLATCLHNVGIPVHNSLDRFGRQTFHPFSATQYIAGKLPDGLIHWERHPLKTGKECCSQFSISFHYVDPPHMRTLEHLLYNTAVFGRKRIVTGTQNFFQTGVVPSLPPTEYEH